VFHHQHDGSQPQQQKQYPVQFVSQNHASKLAFNNADEQVHEQPQVLRKQKSKKVAVALETVTTSVPQNNGAKNDVESMRKFFAMLSSSEQTALIRTGYWNCDGTRSQQPQP
jgi:hypothetical protein